jgi:WD40 repeat protein
MKRKYIYAACLLLIAVLATDALSAGQPEFFVQLGHSATVHSTAFSPDGKYAASGGMDNNVKLWSVETGREMRTLQGHTSYITFVTFSPDGRYIVSASHDMTIRLWDVPGGREVKRISDVLVVSHIAFSPEGDLLFGNTLGTITLWNMQTGVARKLEAAYGKGEISAVTFIERGKYILVARKSGFTVVEPQTDKIIRTFGINTASSSDVSIAFSKDGRYALVGKFNQMILWDIPSGKEIRTFSGKAGKFNSVAFSQDGRYVLSGDEGYMLKMWETATGREVRSIYHYRRYIYGARYGVTAVAFSPDGKSALAGYKNGSIRLWDVFRDDPVVGGVRQNSAAQKAELAEGDTILSVAGKKIRSWPEFTEKVKSSPNQELRIAFMRDQQERSVVMTPAAVNTKDTQGKETIAGEAGLLEGGVCLHHLEGYKQKVSSAALSADGRHLAAGHGDGALSLWNMQTGSQLRKAQPYRNEFSVAFSPRKNIFLSAGDENMTVWSTDSAQPLAKLEQAGISLVNRALAFSPDGRYAAAGGDKKVALYDMQTLRELRSLPLERGAKAVAMSSNNNYLASGASMDVKVWNVQTGAEIRTMRHGSFVYAVDFAFGGRRLVSGAQRYSGIGLDYENTIKLWDVSTGRELLNFSRYKKSVYDARFSPDGRMLLSGGDELVLWDADTGSMLKTFSGHHGMIESVAFLADGKSIMSAGDDGTVRIWSLKTGREMAQFVSFADGEWIGITPEGYFNASPGGAKHLNVRVGNDVYGIDQFYAKFYRPELVELALAGKALPRSELITDIAAQKPAPNVQILSPATNSSVDRDSVAVTLKITDSGGGIGRVNIYLNGAQVANDTRGVIVLGKASANEKILSFTIALVQGQNEIRVVAFNQENSMESNPARISVASRAMMRKPNLYALVIGINTYRNQSISLTYAVPDAIAFAGTLKKVAAPLFEKVDILTLTTPEATTKEAITKAFEDVRQKVGPNDLFIFYNASHGMVDVVNGEEQYFLLTSNVRLLSSLHIGKDALSHKDLVGLIGSVPAQKKLVILDTCNAGKGGKEIQIALLQQTRGLNDATAVKLLQRAVGSSVFSASSDTQQALEGYKGHGLFTYVLLEGLQGAADFKKDGFITVKGLALHTEERVMTLSEDIFKRQQNPMIETGVNDFPIGRVK